ncbi:hypothetical protein B0J11DRAFT_531059 [Dendryphion nanum]|uniref:Uncharacterized protein n=1 Tax=Dendryphion nanum TaxID=256645 RepID=A0A9P9IK71_9PLEO|nr:hypothetical protein B0J11DRAFT_531059 [Dendryphion nanum]
MLQSRPSFDIADNRALDASPAPTYSSMFHAHKDYITPTHTASSNPFLQSTQSSLFSHPENITVNEKRHLQSNNTSDPRSGLATTSAHPTHNLHPFEEPFDRKKTLYGAPTTFPNYPPSPLPPLPPRPKTRRCLRPAILIPWCFALFFFLLTIWYTSIAVGAKFLAHIDPFAAGTNSPPEINVHIHGIDPSVIPNVSVILGGTSASTMLAPASASSSLRGGNAPIVPAITPAPVRSVKPSALNSQRIETIQTGLERAFDELVSQQIGFVTITRRTARP